jgi:hypothetical protein
MVSTARNIEGPDSLLKFVARLSHYFWDTVSVWRQKKTRNVTTALEFIVPSTS